MDIACATAAQTQACNTPREGESSLAAERKLCRRVFDKNVALWQRQAHGISSAVAKIVTGSMGKVVKTVRRGKVILFDLAILIEEAVIGGHEDLTASRVQKLTGNLHHLGDCIFACCEDLALGVARVTALVNCVMVDHHERSVLDIGQALFKDF